MTCRRNFRRKLVAPDVLEACPMMSSFNQEAAARATHFRFKLGVLIGAVLWTFLISAFVVDARLQAQDAQPSSAPFVCTSTAGQRQHCAAIRLRGRAHQVDRAGRLPARQDVGLRRYRHLGHRRLRRRVPGRSRRPGGCNSGDSASYATSQPIRRLKPGENSTRHRFPRRPKQFGRVGDQRLWAGAIHQPDAW